MLTVGSNMNPFLSVPTLRVDVSSSIIVKPVPSIWTGLQKKRYMESSMYEFKREDKYLVLKKEDINAYLIDREQEKLNKLVKFIEEGRYGEKKKPNSYVVVNEDQSYAEKVWALIQAEEERKYGKKA